MSELPIQDKRRLSGRILVGLGILFLLGQIFSINWLGIMWPLFVIIPGLPFLYFALTSTDKDKAGLIFPGLIISGTGLILFIQALTGHFESWAYVWALYPAMVGLGLQFHGERTNNAEERKTGRNMTRGGLIGFAAFGLFFELFIFGGLLGGITGLLLPVALVAVGLYMLSRKGEATDKLKNEDLEKPKRQYDGPAAEIDPELRRKIDAALAEDDETISADGNVTNV